MTTQFVPVYSMITISRNKMVELLQSKLNKNVPLPFLNKNKIDPKYPSFEIFAYLLFHTDYQVAAHQNPAIRYPLYDFIADQMIRSSGMPKDSFNKILDKRMEEYGSILMKWNSGEINDQMRTKTLVDGYLRNLTYAIFEKKLFFWDSNVKPLPLLDIHQLMNIQMIYANVLLPLETLYISSLKKLLTSTPDITRLSDDEIEKVLLS